ncbi:MAG: hypothetical protein KDE27_28215 [Planctomycetes bacterium]|nr:hypothetical protein [Planctomycetota bacterium]
MRVLLLSLAVGSVAWATLPAQVPLAQLAEVARARAERARPAAEAALEPFLADLALPYRTSQEFLDKRIGDAAALGDSVVPLLLEKLVPTENSEKARNLAGNCRRVLERLDPGAFVDALAELLNSQYETTRREAIRLLGGAITPLGERLLLEQLQKTSGEDQRLVLQSLAKHRTKAAARQVVGLLGSADRGLRAEVLDYLTAARAGSVADTVVQALNAEKEDYLLPRYIAYFGKAVRHNDGAARALLGLIGQRIDWRDTREIVNALATVAPPEHEPTIRRLHALLEDEKTSTLAVETAVTLRALGDRQGVQRLKRTLDDALRKPERKREAALYQQRANLLFATGDYAEAADDYEKIIEYSGGISMTRLAYMGLIRCEANRRRWSQLARVIKNSPLNAGEIEAMAYDDEVLQEAFAHDRVESAIEQVRKRLAPK